MRRLAPQAGNSQQVHSTTLLRYLTYRRHGGLARMPADGARPQQHFWQPVTAAMHTATGVRNRCIELKNTPPPRGPAATTPWSTMGRPCTALPSLWIE